MDYKQAKLYEVGRGLIGILVLVASIPMFTATSIFEVFRETFSFFLFCFGVHGVLTIFHTWFFRESCLSCIDTWRRVMIDDGGELYETALSIKPDKDYFWDNYVLILIGSAIVSAVLGLVALIVYGARYEHLWLLG